MRGVSVDTRGGYVSKILYVKMKESGPLRGACPAMGVQILITIYLVNEFQLKCVLFSNGCDVLRNGPFETTNVPFTKNFTVSQIYLLRQIMQYCCRKYAFYYNSILQNFSVDWS